MSCTCSWLQLRHASLVSGAYAGMEVSCIRKTPWKSWNTQALLQLLSLHRLHFSLGTEMDQEYSACIQWSLDNLFKKLLEFQKCFKQIYCRFLNGFEMYADLLFFYRAMLCCCWIQTMVPFVGFCSCQMLKILPGEHAGGAARKRRWEIALASIIIES